MLGKRLRYLILLLGLGIYYIASGEWLSWILLICALALPWLSLALSIPGILKLTVSPTGLETVTMGEQAEVWLLGSSDLPLVPFRGTIRLKDSFTGESIRYRPEKGLPIEHCGCLIASVERGRIYDYMGLFAFPLGKKQIKTQKIVIRPVSVPIDNPPMPECHQALRWKPKPGGGFGENHELRPYRPGDDLKQIHWKLSAKTGNLIYRETMEPVQGKSVLTVTLHGTPAQLDAKMGQLLFLGQYLLEHGHAFDLYGKAKQGTFVFSVTTQSELLAAMDELLCAQPSPDADAPYPAADVQWQYHIGGLPDEH